VITGETASGKSDMAMELARRLGGELICADSWTVYEGFDIGTAKPSRADRAEVPHHLLDVADPREGFSVVLFKRLAQTAIEDISARGKLPIVVGGTGLYIDALLYDYSFLPATSPELRKELNSLSLPELLERAEAADYDLSGIDIRNKRRVIRLIENAGQRPTKQPLRVNTLILGIRRDPAELKSRIERRIDAMVAAGFPDEVKSLGEQYGWNNEPMKAPGYRAFADYVQGKISLEMAKERFRQNDLQLAKKQRTWFKRNSSIHWLSDRSKIDAIVDLVTTNLNN
jgi:tRNA dimethylallyltransferase